MRPTAFQNRLITGVIVFLLFLYTYTALAKLIDRPDFEVAMKQSPLIADYSGQLSWLIPFAELAIVLLMFIPRTRFAGLISSAALLLSFTIYIICLFLVDRELPCRCGGLIEQMGWLGHLLFNICVLTLNITAVFFIAINRSRRTPV